MATATAAKVEESRSKQSSDSKRATLDLLKTKARSTMEFSLFINDADGEKIEVTLKYQSIGARDYDKLVAKHPPKNEQRAEGSSFNIDTFAPALIASCCIEPEMSREDAQAIWDSEDWSRGDLMVLFRNAIELNNRGIDIPFSDNG